jgi:uncharacterized delta-60 repeat protein
MKNQLQELISIALFITLTGLSKLAIAQNHISRDLTYGVNSSILLLSEKCNMQTDDKLLSVGVQTGGKEIILKRYTKNGAPDASFGSNGTSIINLSQTNLSVLDVTQPIFQNDGKILVAGTINYYYGPNIFGTHFYGKVLGVIRFTSDGSLDLSFNGTGYTVFKPGNANTSGSPSSCAYHIALQSDGKIIVSGGGYNLLYYSSSIHYSGEDYTIFRFLPTGILDMSFNGKGYKSVDYFGSHIGPNAPYSREVSLAIGIRPNNEIFTSVQGQTSIGATFWGYYIFSAEGTTATYIPKGEIANNSGDIKTLNVLPDGKFLVSRSFSYGRSDEYSYSEVTRIGQTNNVDTSFIKLLNSNMYPNDSTNSFAHTFFLTGLDLTNQKMVLAGMWSTFQPPSVKYFSLIGLNADGSLDNTFNNGSHIYNEKIYILNTFKSKQIFVQSDGKIVVRGIENNENLAIRYNNKFPIGTLQSQNLKVMNIYPNPCNEQLFLEINDYANTVAEILNLQGQVLQSILLQSNKTTIQINNLKSGIYFVHVKSHGGMIVKKFIKN